MTISEIRQQIANATQLVESWPTWKQHILIRSSLPTVSAPRTPISNGKCDGEDNQKAMGETAAGR